MHIFPDNAPYPVAVFLTASAVKVANGAVQCILIVQYLVVAC